MATTFSALLRSTRDALLPIADELSLSEAERILQHVLRCQRSDLYLSPTRLVDGQQRARVDTFIKRRLTGEPLQYVLGIAHFYSLSLVVGPDVLIPRPETEILVETVLAHEKANHERYLDFGVGSGAICAALALNRPRWHGVGLDVSPAALRIARINCPPLKVKLLCCNALSAIRTLSVAGGIARSYSEQSFGAVAGNAAACFDFIVSNPPYVSDGEMLQLDDSVKLFEPHEALDGGRNGLDFYDILARESKRILAPGGRLYCEIGATQGQQVVDLLRRNEWKEIRIVPDLAQRSRVVFAVA
jgi:release factor glutamine methyltransferase